MTLYRDLAKRCFDVMLAGIVACVLAPVMLAVTAAIRVKLGRPVLFRQPRPGLGGSPFLLIKFRTMTDARDSAGGLLPDEQRLTPFGKWLRSTSLDELPELWNVLAGDMSIVGPRPLLIEYLDCYTPQQARRHEVKPGLTGLAQVNGRNAISWEERFRLDVQYVDQISFVNDLKILLKTLDCVVRQTGINAPFCATMQPFVGSSPEIAAPSAEIAA